MTRDRTAAALVAFISVTIALLGGIFIGMGLASSTPTDIGQSACTQQGGVWIAGAAHSKCAAPGSFTSLMLNAGG